MLVEANNPKEAYQKAEQHARKEESDSLNTYYYEERAATWVFAGIRKLVDCEDMNLMPRDGTEVSYSTLEVNREEDLIRLINGEIVTVKYLD
ncbi:MAG: DUF4288 domain-containing protein [Thiotrichaceae bacterium]|nr:DUF4288 domain-containing protein [Thiotrichaceae bacterium]